MAGLKHRGSLRVADLALDLSRDHEASGVEMGLMGLLPVFALSSGVDREPKGKLPLLGGLGFLPKWGRLP